jgi:hypothetical protein
MVAPEFVMHWASDVRMFENPQEGVKAIVWVGMY